MTGDRHIFIKNIYYMLSYAFSALREKPYTHIATETFDHVHDLYAAILTAGVGVWLRRGLYKTYVTAREDLSVVRGKIDLSVTLRHQQNRRPFVTCEHDSFSENNTANQILKEMMWLLSRDSHVDTTYRDLLRKQLRRFGGVCDIDLRRVNWQAVRIMSLPKSLKTLLLICKFITDGALLTTDDGRYYLAAFTDTQKMCELYEAFILAYYKREFAARVPGFSAQAAPVYWQVDDGARDLLPMMLTDMTLVYGRRVLIIDAKYYNRILLSHAGRRIIHPEDLYQIFAYVKNKATAGYQVGGMLLYAKTDEMRLPDQCYQMRGNPIFVKTLDLYTDFSEIKRALNEIVTDYFDLF